VYDGKTVAKAEENLLLRSQELDNAIWLKVAASVTANTTAAPDGTTTAETLTASATNENHLITQVITTSSDTRVVSFFAKKGTLDFVQFAAAGDVNVFANFDLDAGVVGTKGSAVSASSMVDVGNGWFRCISVYASAAAANIGLCLVTSASAARREVWTALGTETVFLWGAQLEQRSAVTAYQVTTTQSITNYIPVLQSAANNVARFDHNPVSGESLGLLVEEQRTNLILYSQEFGDVSWTKTNATVIDNTVIAPDGTLTGDLLKASDLVTSSARDIRQNTNTAVSVVNTFSCYAKARNGNFLNMTFRNQAAATNFCAAEFNLSTGVVSVAASNGGNATGASASITSVGNGWYRCLISGIADTSGTQISTLLIGRTSSNSNAVAENTELCFIWGAQLEAGAFPTSYIPTVASQVTRSADAASMTGANFSSWYRADEGTLYTEANKLFAASGYVYSITDGTLTNEIRQTWGGNNNRFLEITTNSVSQSSLSFSSAYINGVFVKTAHAYKFNDIAASVDSATVATDTSAIIPAVNQMQVGARVTNITSNNSTIKKLAFYPKRLTNAQLQSLTG
jgi:hypothetical protein